MNSQTRGHKEDMGKTGWPWVTFPLPTPLRKVREERVSQVTPLVSEPGEALSQVRW